MKRLAVRLAALAAIAGGFSCSAAALDEIYSPNTEYREFAFEANASRTFDSDPTKNNAQSREFLLEAGIAPRWTAELSSGFVKDPGRRLKMQALAAEARYQFFEQGENWLDSGLLINYAHAIDAGAPDVVEIKLLLQKDLGKTTSTANIGFDQAVGPHATGGPDYVMLWNTRYRLDETFQPGIELQNDLGQDATLRHFSDQDFYLGPTIWGRLFGHLKYQVAWMAGITEASSHSAARLHLEYEWHF